MQLSLKSEIRHLKSTAFYDVVALRYGWDPARLHQHCSCGARFSIEHSFSCPKGGFPTIRHNEIRNFAANLLTGVCHGVQVEPRLQLISGEQFQQVSLNIEDGAHLDIAANGFWGGRCEKIFLDVILMLLVPYSAKL